MVKKAVKRTAKRIANKTHDLLFQRIHKKNLIYNACWEDPRIDRELFQLDARSKVVMITSAGCNALDYLLCSPAEIHAIDMNPLQNALFHLKRVLIERDNFEDLFGMFGVGHVAKPKRIYAEVRSELPEYAQKFWDRKMYYFEKPKIRSSFYYHGAAGKAAWLMRKAIHMRKSIRQPTRDILEAETVEKQCEIYSAVERKVWGRLTTWLIRRPTVMALLGVPRAQMLLISRIYPGGLAKYVEDKMRKVLTAIPIVDNYFWRVYMNGSYTRTCCPNYLKEENQDLLRSNLPRVETHNSTVSQFLKDHPGKYTHYTLLDHQDWLAHYRPEALEEEWDLILKNSEPGTKIIMRSAGLEIDFIPEWAAKRLKTRPEISDPLHDIDRVGTYGSLLFAEVK